jgi:hypothetical protein
LFFGTPSNKTLHGHTHTHTHNIGMTVARFNLARTTRYSIRETLLNLKTVLDKTNGLCATLLALKGTNLRTGEGKSKPNETVFIKEKQIYTFYCDDEKCVDRFLVSVSQAKQKKKTLKQIKYYSRDLEMTSKSAYINCRHLPSSLKPGIAIHQQKRDNFCVC